MKKFLFLIIVLFAAAVLSWQWFLQQMQGLADQPLSIAEDDVVLTVNSGTNGHQLLREFQGRGWLESDPLLRFYFRIYPEQAALRAGHYRIEPTMSLRAALQRIVDGDIVQYDVRFIEGWRFRDIRRALSNAPLLKQRLPAMSDQEVMQALGANIASAEGQFFPASYRYTEQVSDLDLLKLAYERMQQELNAAWENRVDNLPYESPYQALIMASLVEKETGQASDRAQIAGVFVRRLQKRMRLQTDPSVIYGLGETFDGNLRKIDLQTDTPYNTYTRGGLPPSPIAMPGKDALLAATQPASGETLYFVARGDGSSEFSVTLDQHNAAVRRYQLKRQK
jgi:UPF0755 protein